MHANCEPIIIIIIVLHVDVILSNLSFSFEWLHRINSALVHMIMEYADDESKLLMAEIG